MDAVQEYYKNLIEYAFASTKKVAVATDFHGRMTQINNILGNDKTALISTILEFMVGSGTVDININTDNSQLTKALKDWKANVNKNINIDIPKGLRSFTEQYFRERWKSSFIVLVIKWAKINGFILPDRMYLMDGASIYVDNKKKNLNTNQYWFGQPYKEGAILLNDNKSDMTTYLIRKPYNQWYDQYPTPYLVKTGAIYHAEVKRQILSRQEDFINPSIPYSLFIKLGSDEAIRRGLVPSKEDLSKVLAEFKENLSENEHTLNLGAYPHDVKFEDFIPDYKKVLDPDVLKNTDKNLLSSLGMIEFTGFSSNREEAILNPKVLIEEVQNGVFDYVELLSEVMDLIKEKNKAVHRNIVNNEIRVMPGVVKAFVTDEMRSLIRSLYDRGVVSKKSTLENTTALDFSVQVNERDFEKKDKIDERMYPPVVQNQEQQENETEQNEDVPDDKKKNTPEANNYKNALFCETIVEPIKRLKDIPEDIRGLLKQKEQKIFKDSFNEAFKKATDLQLDDDLREKFSLEFAYNKLKELKSGE